MSKKIILPILVLFAAFNLNAQKTDSLAMIREFLSVSNAYKQPPLHLVLEYRSISNLVFAEEDTSFQQGEFYITPNGSYIRFGEMEQIVADSEMLIVSNKMQRMIFYDHSQDITAGMKNFMSVAVTDSSIINLSQKYRAATGNEKNDMAYVELTSKILLNGTSLPKEWIRIRYDAKTKKPVEVIQVQRNLVPLEEGDENSLPPGNQLHVVSNEKGKFLMREQTATFVYRRIEHDTSIRMPVQIADRIVRNEEGRYVPVKGYENYLVSQNN